MPLKNGREIYGLTVGVGLNKDHKVLSANGELSDEVKAASRRFNYSTLRSHSVAAGPILDPKLVRLAMAIRLNTLLNGVPASSESCRTLCRILE